MQTTFALAAIAAVSYAAPQGVAVNEDISPTGSAPAGFATNFASPFQITAVDTTIVVARRDIAKAATGVATVLSDGEPEVSSAIVIAITQATDGQPATTIVGTATALISEISDGQPQVPTSTAALITQATDGQPAATIVATATAPISEISDGQPQAPTSVALSTAASTGVIQAPTNGTSVTTPTAPAAITASGGNAVTVGSSLIAMVVGLVAALL